MKQFALACWILWAPAALALEVSGTVVDDQDAPVEGATVRLQTQALSVLSGPDGSYTFSDPNQPFDPNLPFLLTAGKTGFVSGSEFVSADSQTGLDLVIKPVPEDDPDFVFSSGRPEFCRGCHQDTMYTDFKLSRHSNAGKNAWVAAMLQDFRTRHPGESGFCADCHAPGAFVGGKQPGAVDLADPNTVDLLALDPNAASSPRRNGVQCLTCHRVTSVDEESKGINFAGGATISRAANPLHVFGPWDDVTEMQASPLALYNESRFCAPCHEYQRPPGPGRPPVPGQLTFSEWRRWQARLPQDSPLKDKATCQYCHMPAKPPGNDVIRACDYGPGRDPERQPVRTHTFAGTVLGPGVLLPDGTASMLEGAGLLDIQAVWVAADELEASVQLSNVTAGHKLPTGIDIRNMLVLVQAWDAAGVPLAAVPERSSVLPYWAGEGTGPEDLAGQPGKGYAKILSRSLVDFANHTVQRVEFAEAECEVLDNRIEGGLSDASSYVFRLPPGAVGPIKVLARAVWRRAFADFTERFNLPRTDVLGNPLAEHELARARVLVDLPGSFSAPSGTVDLDFEADAAGTPFGGLAAVADEAFAAHGLHLTSVATSRAGCGASDGHVYAVQDGQGDRVLAPGTAATHNECQGGILRLDFSPPVGHVSFEVQTQQVGAGFELRAFDPDGREVALERAYDEAADCELHPVAQSFEVHLDHHGIGRIEARGVVETALDEQVLWSLRRLQFRFDSVHPPTAGPVATPTPTPPPQQTPTPTPTLGPVDPLVEPVVAGNDVVTVTGALPPGSRVEIRGLDGDGNLAVLGAGTSDEDGIARIWLLRPLAPGEAVHAINLRTLREGPETIASTPIPAPVSGAALCLLALVLLNRMYRGKRHAT